MKLIGIATTAMLVLQGTAFADILPVCERTPAVSKVIVETINEEQHLTKTCAEITSEDLASLKRVDVSNQGIKEFLAGDFSGLVNLEILNIRSNPYTTLTEGLFKDLTKLTTMVIIGTSLRYFPDDFLQHTPNITHLHSFRNQVRTISLSVLQRFAANKDKFVEIDLDKSILDAEETFLAGIFAGTNAQLAFRGN